MESLPSRVLASTAWRTLWCLLIATAALARPAAPQDARAVPDREALIAAARELMTAQKYCALITIGEDGRPQVRTMNPFAPEEDLTIWFATNSRSRKVQEIRRDDRVLVYYANHVEATGYVALTGRAVLVDDMAEILKRKREYWDTAFPGLKNLVLIKVVPERLDVLNYKRGALGDTVTWRTPSIELTPAPKKP
jgi:general stress protein 26